MPPSSHAHLTFRLSPTDVGRRVAVRRLLPNGMYADILGELESWSDGMLRIRRRDGSEVEIDLSALVSGKVIPPPPAKRRGRGQGASPHTAEEPGTEPGPGDGSSDD